MGARVSTHLNKDMKNHIKKFISYNILYSLETIIDKSKYTNEQRKYLRKKWERYSKMRVDGHIGSQKIYRFIEPRYY